VQRGGFLDDAIIPNVVAAAERLRSVERIGDLARASTPAAGMQKEATA
jgi:hypothetical protein